jgi:hypothetical protein
MPGSFLLISALFFLKVKQKVSGCFRTNLGADIYMKLHSVTDTTKKNGNSMFDALLAIAVLQR